MKWVYRIAPALICILLAGVVFVPVPGHLRWVRTLHDSAHGPVFGVVALLALSIVRGHPRWGLLASSRQYFAAFAVAVLLGAVSELAQIPAGGDASFADLGHDILGALAFLAMFLAFDPARPAHLRPLARAGSFLVAVCLLAVLMAPVARAVVEYQRRDARFPMLADFSRGFDRYFIRQVGTCIEPATLPAAWAVREGESAMRVTFQAGLLYPGIQFIEPPPDWTAGSALAFDLTNPTDSALELVVRVHDARHDNAYDDRFNRSLRIAAKTRKVFRFPLAEIRAAPATRQLDLRNVAAVVLFRVNASAASQMYVSRVWLE